MSESRRWIITGMSGAGKQTALEALAGQGVDCADNLPAGLDAGWAALDGGRARAAIIDARRGDALHGWVPPGGVAVVFLDARDEVLCRRLAESTRPHPCAYAGNVPAQIAAERELVAPLRAAADTVIDTSDLAPRALGECVVELAGVGGPSPRLQCLVSSFGYKYGPQREADWVIDARFLPNPFWVKELRPRTGLDADVRDYVLQAPETQEFLTRLDALLAWTVARYVAQKRRALHIAVGCTGGRHRSVALATELAARIGGDGVDVAVRHRDVERPDHR